MIYAKDSRVFLGTDVGNNNDALGVVIAVEQAYVGINYATT